MTNLPSLLSVVRFAILPRMRYANDIPVATRADLLAVMRAEDPVQVVDSNLEVLRQIGETVAGEVAKWKQAREALGSFDNDPRETGVPKSEVRTASDSAGAADAATSISGELRGAPNNGGRANRATIPLHRRHALIRLLSSQPGRAWRTRELAEEIERVEPEGAGDMGNLVSRALGVLEDEGLVERIKKGTVRWDGPNVPAPREDNPFVKTFMRSGLSD
jgi:hypothetical protein